mmetsp:Transcript_4353/g.9027  ORF Transcript_4353/g.9027 Transcript_4353/m.9027 type:complete len:264 (+) Transcript_4353:120-911(+)
MALPIGPCEEYEKSGTRRSGGSGDDNVGSSDGDGVGVGVGVGGRAFLEEQMERAFALLRERVTGASLEQRLRWKYSVHNARADVCRRAVVEDYAAANPRPSKKRKMLATNECADEADDDDDDDEESANADASSEPPQSQPQSQPHTEDDEADSIVVGPKAASKVRLETLVRASTPSERESVAMEEGKLRGLTVREETHGALMSILAGIKNHPGRSFVVGSDLRGLAKNDEGDDGGLDFVCDFTLLSFARCCVELGALAMVCDS